MNALVQPAASQTIPVVSLEDFLHGGPTARANFVQTLGDALVDIGFFALEGHSIDPVLTARAYSEARRFFQLPVQRRLSYEDPGVFGQRGYTSFGREQAKDSPAPDLKEFWHVGREIDDDPRSRLMPYRNIWPTELPEFKTVMTQLFHELDTCAAALLRACSIYLDEPEGYLPEVAECGDSILRIIHYPPVPPDRDPGSIRAAAHEDINLITLLCEATAGGLELLQRDGSWRPIHALDGQIVVDAGDMLQYLTHGRFRSTTHRVTNPENDREARFSMPYFVHPRAEVDLTPRAFRRGAGSSRVPPLTAGMYLHQRLQEIGLKGSRPMSSRPLA